MIKLLLSFKENEEYLYNEICKHSSKSGFVKDLIKDYLNTKVQQDFRYNANRR